MAERALDFQYGDWWRREFESGDVAPWSGTAAANDLTVLIAMVLTASRPLLGPPPAEVLGRVSRRDVTRAMLEGIDPLLADLDDDTRNVVLTLTRIWTTLGTGEFRSKDAAADWALERLPVDHRAVLARARAIYLGDAPERWDDLHSAGAASCRLRRRRDPAAPDRGSVKVRLTALSAAPRAGRVRTTA